MNKLMMIGCLGAVVFATGCITVNKNDGGCAELAPKVVKEKVLLQYDIKDKSVTASDTVQQVLGFQFGSSASHIADDAPASKHPIAIFPNVAERAKNGAFAKACDTAGADTLVGTRYKVTVNDYIVYKRATAEVTGYPATLKGVKKLECPKDCPKNCCAK